MVNWTLAHSTVLYCNKTRQTALQHTGRWPLTRLLDTGNRKGSNAATQEGNIAIKVFIVTQQQRYVETIVCHELKT